MNKKFLVFLIIPIIISMIVLIFNQNEIVNEEKIRIIENEIKDVKDDFEQKSDEEVQSIIEESYDEIKSRDETWTPSPRQWQSSGPFKIDREEYILGEKIFLIAEGLDFEENGEIVILRELNSTHYNIWKKYPFDGMIKTAFNVYFEPKLDKKMEICQKEQLIGNWAIVFRGVEYPNMKFRIIDQILPGDEDKFEDIC